MKINFQTLTLIFIIMILYFCFSKWKRNNIVVDVIKKIASYKNDLYVYFRGEGYTVIYESKNNEVASWYNSRIEKTILLVKLKIKPTLIYIPRYLFRI